MLKSRGRSEQPVQVRLVTDFADEHGLAVSGFEHHPVEDGLETLAQPPTQDNADWPRPGRFAGTTARRAARRPSANEALRCPKPHSLLLS